MTAAQGARWQRWGQSPLSAHRPAMRSVAFVPLVLLLAACASTNPAALLRDVRGDTRARTGADLQLHAGAGEALLQRPLTADGAVQLALANNRHLRATLEGLGIAQAEHALALTPANPTLAASWRFPSGGGKGNPEFGLTQEILGLLVHSQRKKIARSQLDQERRRITREITDLALETREAFYTLQAEEQLLGRLRAVAEVQSAASELSKRLHDAGNISDLEFREQQSGALELELEIRQAQARIVSLREKLHRLMGVNGAARWTIVPSLPGLPASEPGLASLLERGLAQRLDLAIARDRLLQAGEAHTLKRRTRHLPGLNVGFNTERESDGTQLSGPTLDLELPLFPRGRAELAKLSAEARQAGEEAAAIESDIRSEVREAHGAMLAARGAAEFAGRRLLPSQQEILRETLLHYNAMQKSNFELLAAKERELRAERRAVETLRDYWLARVTLERAVGGRVEGRVQPASVRSVPRP